LKGVGPAQRGENTRVHAADAAAEPRIMVIREEIARGLVA
jgi:hypothetical protein